MVVPTGEVGGDSVIGRVGGEEGVVEDASADVEFGDSVVGDGDGDDAWGVVGWDPAPERLSTLGSSDIVADFLPVSNTAIEEMQCFQLR